jgi:Ni/Fe-hydrogenase 1 B-type cytochrome subunit
MQTSQPSGESRALHPGEGRSGSSTYNVSETEARKDVYVWELPVRITHWVTVISIGILTVTGIYLATPFIGTSGPASDQYLMGTVRFIHFVTAFVFTASVLFRIYWAFVGNTYARWNQFLPTNAARRRDARRMLTFYLFLRRDPPAEVGHNPLAGMTYVVVFALFLLQIITGFALYALPFDQGTFWPTAFGWITVTFGVQPVRLVHDIIMWLLLAFTIHHVYSCILIDIEERSGLVSSIVTGFKTLTRRQLAAAAAEETPDPRRRPFWARFSRKAGQDDA